jgi:hypothetical protein
MDGILLPGLRIELLSIVILPSPCFFVRLYFLRWLKGDYALDTETALS